MIKIDINKNFPHLSRAPIVEAVIEIRSGAARPWNEEDTLQIIKNNIPEYPSVEDAHGFSHSFSIGPDQNSSQEYADLGLKGFRLTSEDKRYIALFNVENFTLSRLSPYENWSLFSIEAFRMWNLYKNISGSCEINRLGLRFINKIPLPSFELNFGDYLTLPPTSPEKLDLPFLGFFHQDTMLVPDYGYRINLIRTIQSSPDGGLNILLDIDILIEDNIADENNILLKHFEEMRFLKNSVFFNSMTNKTLEMLK